MSTDIPKNIFLCHKSKNNINFYIDNWAKLNPDYAIKFFDDEECAQFLLNEYGEIHHAVFNYIPDGPIKADFWRVCILFKRGGFYSDIDNEPLVPIVDFLDHEADFLLCSSYWEKEDFLYNPNFIMAKKGNIFLKKCIDWYTDSFISHVTYDYWYWSIVRIMTIHLKLNKFDSKDGIYRSGQMKVQILREIKGVSHYDDHNLYKGARVFNNRYKNWDYKRHEFKQNKFLRPLKKIKRETLRLISA
jgi:mannosyltransferase OCH1-like enzyme